MLLEQSVRSVTLVSMETSGDLVCYEGKIVKMLSFCFVSGTCIIIVNRSYRLLLNACFPVKSNSTR